MNSRRGFLLGAASLGGALIVSSFMPPVSRLAQAQDSGLPKGPPAPNAFIRIAPDNTVTVIVKHLDKGQGVRTGLPAIVAEELDADWSQIRSEHSPANATLYANLVIAPYQVTGSSTSMFNSWDQLRLAGAAARHMLLAAAAAEWNVPAASLTIAKGIISHGPSGRTSGFGAFAVKAASLPVPLDVKPKDPKDWKLIGTRLPRLDSVAKTTGQATFGIDVKRPGALTALLRRPDRFGAMVKRIDDTEAKKVAGFVQAVSIGGAAAVLCRDMWSAIKARDALTIEWDETKAETRGTAELLTEYKALAAKPGTPAGAAGDVEAGLKRATKTVEAEFVFPYLAHAPMEPLNCTIERTPDGGCLLTGGSQSQTGDQYTIAAILGIKPEQVSIDTTWAGGSFGRRASTMSDWAAEAALVLKISGATVPVKVMWTRDDDIKGGFYRPMYVHRVTAGVDANGAVAGWRHRIAGQSIGAGTPVEGALVQNGIDYTSVEGARDMPYAIANRSFDLHTAKAGVPVLWWRSVGHTHTAFAVETIIDDLAAAAGKDPVSFRLAMLDGHPRHAAVLKLAAEKAGWGQALPKGRARGVAVHESFGSYVANVVEVTVQSDGSFRVDRVVCAVDCGVAVTPDIVVAQIEGGVGYGLGAALYGQITLTKGVVDQSNFHDFVGLRIDQMPVVEVHIVPSQAPPTGIGEPAVPCVAPAVSNAIFAATGKRIRSLPMIPV